MCRHDEQPRQEGTGEEAGGRRLEEAELAAKVGSRRAAAAEAEVERLQRVLADAEKRSESLAWQVGPMLQAHLLHLVHPSSHVWVC